MVFRNVTVGTGGGTITFSYCGNPATAAGPYEGDFNGLQLVCDPVSIASGLTNGTMYYFKVASVDSSGQSAPSSEASATPTGLPGLGTPASVTATAGNGQVTLSWQPIAGATSYNVYGGTNSGGEVIITNVSAGLSGFTLT